MSQASSRQPVPVGKYFLDRGKITPQQLEIALKHRSEFGLKLGQSLVELGLVTEADMVEALRHQGRFPCVHLTNGIVEARIANKVGATLSRRLHAVALNQIAGHTTVAIADPTDAPALEELAHILATRIFPVYAEPSAIKKMLDHVFGPEKGAPRAAPSSQPEPAPARAREKEPEPVPEAAPDERAVVERVRSMLQEAFARGVSDIHLEATREELLVRFRAEGELREHARLPRGWLRPTLACLKSLAKLETSDSSLPDEGTIPFLFNKQQLEVRVATIPTRHGECAVLHVLRPESVPPGLHALGLSEEQLSCIEEFLPERRGLMLVVSPAGNGRTTTFRALLERFVAPDRKVVAIDENVGREIDGVLQVRADRRSGLGYASGARALLRHDPDVLAVAEVDTPETARTVLEAALTGRMAVASVRAIGALEALVRLTGLGLEPYLVADSLRVVVAQHLVRRICPECKTPIVPDDVLRARLGLTDDGATYWEGEGCAACNGTGYRGHQALFEVMTMTPGLRRAVEKGEPYEALAQIARSEGFVTLRDHGMRLARTGLTTLHEILKTASRER